MPKFTITVIVTNNGTTSVTAHVGASLVGATNHIEYYNTSEDIKYTFPVGDTTITRYLTSDLGAYQKYFSSGNILFEPFVLLFCIPFYFVVII